MIRNAGGRATEDAVRSLLISSWLLGTREFLVIHHTDCGMEKFTDEAMTEIITQRCGQDVSHLDFLTFRDLDQSVRDDVDRIRSLSQIPAEATVSGHVYDVRTGTLREVVRPSSRSRGRSSARSPGGPDGVRRPGLLA